MMTTASMTSQERFSRMFAHQEADRIPIIDYPWDSTIERWHQEGMPQNISFVDYFDIDHVGYIRADNSPRYPEKVLEETAEHKIYTSKWGVTMKQWKHIASTPEFMDFTIVDMDSWKKAKEQMKPDRDRINWKHLATNYPLWKKNGAWIEAQLWFGFDITHSWVVGTERLLMALLEDPEWCMDMFAHELDVNIKLLDMIWDAGYHFDAVKWPDDMGFKHSQFFSVATYREILKPFHKRAIDWVHSKGAKAHLHSCGDVNPFIPELIGLGLDALNPLEVKAGMDPIHLKKTYGKDLVFHGGINAVLWDQPEKIQAEMERVIPIVKEGGGYIFSSDHSVPSSVSLEDFRSIVENIKRLGSF